MGFVHKCKGFRKIRLDEQPHFVVEKARLVLNYIKQNTRIFVSLGVYANEKYI